MLDLGNLQTGTPQQATSISSRQRKLTEATRAFIPAVPLAMALAMALSAVLPQCIRANSGGSDLDPAFVAEEFRTFGRAGYLPGLDPPLAMNSLRAREIRGGSGLMLGLDASMNRVDGISLIGVQEIPSTGLVPGMRAYQAYGFTSKQWSGAFELRLSPFGEAFSLGMRWFDETTARPLPVQHMRSVENFLNTFFLREDSYDYLRRRGRSAFAEWAPSPGRGLQASLSEEEHESLERIRKRLGLFGGNKEFAENPAVDEDTWNLLRVRGIWSLGRVPDGPSRPAEAHAILAEVQAAGGPLGDERRFVRVWGEMRGNRRVSSTQFVSYRIGGGWTPEGEQPLLEDGDGDPFRDTEQAAQLGGRDPSRLPEQWKFEAGGPGSLRSHEFQAFRGDRIFLATLEYGLEPYGEVQPVMFVDWGKAWYQCQRESGGIGGSGPLEIGGGMGVAFGKGALAGRLDVARDLRAKRAPARVLFRLGVPF